jgi:hypothetical protein
LWRGLSACCAESRLGVSGNVVKNVDAAGKNARATSSNQRITIKLPVTSWANFYSEF